MLGILQFWVGCAAQGTEYLYHFKLSLGPNSFWIECSVAPLENESHNAYVKNN